MVPPIADVRRFTKRTDIDRPRSDRIGWPHQAGSRRGPLPGQGAMVTIAAYLRLIQLSKTATMLWANASTNSAKLTKRTTSLRVG